MFPTSAALDTLQTGLARDLRAVLPELLLIGTIVVVLLLRLTSAFRRAHLGPLALLLTCGAVVVAASQWSTDPVLAAGRVELFSGLLIYDDFGVFARLVLLTFTALTLLLGLITGIPDSEDSGDFVVLLLGSAVGMCVMTSVNHLLMLFLAVEMASLPSYALAGFLKGNRRASEASLKYVVYGAGASGVMLYGISLLAGTFGTGYLPDIAKALVLHGATSGPVDPVIVLGVLFILVGLGFKLAAVPFHFWCPDVFEGAAAEVAGFLSVASKAAAVALLARFSIGLLGAGGSSFAAGVAGDPLARTFAFALIGLAILTATVGNLAAFGQTNLKRLLAYSTIAHAGYMLMALATLRPSGAGVALFYLATYLFMNLGAFALVAFLRNRTGSEEVTTYRGLVHRAPVLTVCLAICLLSLLGLPPLAGFAAKFQIFASVYDAARLHSGDGSGLGSAYLVLLIAGGLNTAFSAVYYLRVLKVLIVDAPPAEVVERPTTNAGLVFSVGAATVVVVLGLAWNDLDHASVRGGAALRPVSVQQAAVPIPAAGE